MAFPTVPTVTMRNNALLPVTWRNTCAKRRQDLTRQQLIRIQFTQFIHHQFTSFILTASVKSTSVMDWLIARNKMVYTTLGYLISHLCSCLKNDFSFVYLQMRLTVRRRGTAQWRTDVASNASWQPTTRKLVPADLDMFSVRTMSLVTISTNVNSKKIRYAVNYAPILWVHSRVTACTATFYDPIFAPARLSAQILSSCLRIASTSERSVLFSFHE